MKESTSGNLNIIIIHKSISDVEGHSLVDDTVGLG